MKHATIFVVILLAISFVSGQRSGGILSPPIYLPTVELCPPSRTAYFPEEVAAVVQTLRGQGCRIHIEPAPTKDEMYMVYGTRIVND